MPRIHQEYIDDLTKAESKTLKTKLIKNTNPNPSRPLQYHERTEHVLPEGQSQVQAQLDQLCAYSKDHQMQINNQKTKAILLNSARNYDFMPKCSIAGGEEIEFVE